MCSTFTAALTIKYSWALIFTATLPLVVYTAAEWEGRYYMSMSLSRYLVLNPLFSCILMPPSHGRLIHSWQLSHDSLEEACVNHVCLRGVTLIDSIVTAATAGQNFEKPFSTFDRKYMEECIASPHFLSWGEPERAPGGPVVSFPDSFPRKTGKRVWWTAYLELVASGTLGMCIWLHVIR